MKVGKSRAVCSLVSSRGGVFGSTSDGLGQLNTDEENIPLDLMPFHSCGL